MNHEAILALIGELYANLGQASRDNAALHQQIAVLTAEPVEQVTDTA